MIHRPFRFAVTAPPVGESVAAWGVQLRELEDAGFDTLVVADHFTDGWDVEPMVTLTAAAAATSRLRLQTGVLGNDYRHPVLVHRMAATLALLSGGRFTLGMGAGWLRSDYEAAGLPYDRPGVRIDRLAEAVEVITALFGPDLVDHDGAHYRINGLRGVPTVAQRPPLMLGGGSPRMLRLAGAKADIVSIVASLRAGEITAGSSTDLSAPAVAEKLSWVREGAVSGGRDPAELTLSINHWLVRVTPTEAAAEDLLARVASRQGVDEELLRESPAVLVGSIERLVDVLEQRRDTFGLSHFQLDAGFHPADVRSLYPLVDALAGR